MKKYTIIEVLSPVLGRNGEVAGDIIAMNTNSGSVPGTAGNYFAHEYPSIVRELSAAYEGETAYCLPAFFVWTNKYVYVLNKFCMAGAGREFHGADILVIPRNPSGHDPENFTHAIPR